MPQPEASSLLTRVLLLWTTVLTMGLVGWVAFTATYFTGTNWQQQTYQPTETPTMDAEKSLAKMMEIEATNAGVNASKIEWKDLSNEKLLVSIEKETVTIKADGYYFVCLKVTLDNNTQTNEHKVSLHRKGKTILEDVIPIRSNSTKLLGKVQKLSATDMLTVTIHPPAQINTTSTATYMGLIYIPFTA